MIVLLILCVLQYYDDSVSLINLYGSNLWQKSSRTSLQTYNLMNRNSDTLRNTDPCNIVSQIFHYNRIPKSKWRENIQCYNGDIDDKDNSSGHNTGETCTPSVSNIMFKTLIVLLFKYVINVLLLSSDKKVETIAQNARITTSVEYRPSIGTDVCYKPDGILISINTNHYKKYKHNDNYSHDYDTDTSNYINNNGIIGVTRVDSRWLVDIEGNRSISEVLRETNIIHLTQNDFVDGPFVLKNQDHMHY